jgi:hypothetical protein
MTKVWKRYHDVTFSRGFSFSFSSSLWRVKRLLLMLLVEGRHSISKLHEDGEHIRKLRFLHLQGKTIIWRQRQCKTSGGRTLDQLIFHLRRIFSCRNDKRLSLRVEEDRQDDNPSERSQSTYVLRKTPKDNCRTVRSGCYQRRSVTNNQKHVLMTERSITANAN